MAGHSKWANIKRQKARVDAVKGKVFTKISREIIVAARCGVPDPTANFQLRTAIAKAKAVGIPNDNIDRAIAKGAGSFGSNDGLESIRYEGYGAGGVAVLVEALTDNRNRTAAILREAFSKNGGNLGETGCVSWMFEQKGVAELSFFSQDSRRGRQRPTPTAAIDEEALLEACLEGGADTYEVSTTEDGYIVEVFTGVETLEALSQTLQDRGYTVTQVELRWQPQTTVEITDAEQARSLLKLMDALDDLDDVQTATANFDLAEMLIAAFV
ncbi:YebC/PmpR family DNA-binding transcriptional regulator [Myxacorys almedinensis]|uniref:Probable transcriptional regulatory protein GS601_07720 n=1 Tax=Myxacorys almedinensis A TaxID=2690445 RepID=A0A8J8CME8_9CYAN|nr:YebC/PmpR family DNA-binding transcriptional regulator [Myxacorys almedinensis]NDJ17177.1 YebC/PmpR family DNA-binding transcriptional regulator [Myxacorys almedinensis A]